MKYIAITICRNEEKYIERVIDSVLNQTIKPAVYVVVDDSSTDNTAELIKKYNVHYIKVKGERNRIRSYNLCRAVNLGFKVATDLIPDWSFALKLDGDSIIPNDYVEFLISKFHSDKKLGILSGTIRNRNMWIGRASDGAKLYSKKCWNKINGLDYVIGWDTHAIIKAYQKGFRVRTSKIKYDELRSSKRMKLGKWYLSGATRYYLGFPLWHTFGICILYLNDYPYLLGSITMFLSHLIYRLKCSKRVFNKEYYDFALFFSYWEFMLRKKMFRRWLIKRSRKTNEIIIMKKIRI